MRNEKQCGTDFSQDRILDGWYGAVAQTYATTQSGMGELMTTGESVDYHRRFEDNLRATILSKMAAQRSMYSDVALPEAGTFMKDSVEDINNLMRNQPRKSIPCSQSLIS